MTLTFRGSSKPPYVILPAIDKSTNKEVEVKIPHIYFDQIKKYGALDDYIISDDGKKYAVYWNGEQYSIEKKF